MGNIEPTGASNARRQLLFLQMRLWRRVRESQLRVIPRPHDATRVQCAVESPGNAADWVLIVGGGPARGWGVRSHNDALPGHLARALTTRTGRSTDVTIVDAPTRTAIRDAVLLRVHARYEAIVVVTGIDDALEMRCPNDWRRSLRGMLAGLTGPKGVDSPIVVVGIPPVRSIPVFDTGLGSIAAAHALELNAVTVEVCAEFDLVSFAPLMDPGPSTLGHHRDSEAYRRWAHGIAKVVRPMLGSRRLLESRELV